ncbi:MAG: inositol-3-phosphate synthase, partial [Pseudomonadota bacterium]
GVDIVDTTTTQAVEQVYRRSRTITHETLETIRPGLRAIDANVAHEPALRWSPLRPPGDGAPLARIVETLRRELRAFRERNTLDAVVVVNLASAEPEPADAPAQRELDALEGAIAEDRKDQVSPAMVTAYAAFAERCPYVNFTPNLSVRCPSLQQFAASRSLPYYGDDGKTGETLVKTALGPMFACRNLHVMSWEGTNLLGNNDGRALDDADNRVAKLRNKASVLDSIVGYPVHSNVNIDYVPSLGDWKTAWDLVHFRGFMDVPMSLQFTWQGCDSVLAAPLILDMARLAEFAQRKGESGPMVHLAMYFKNPLEVDEMSLYPQFETLLAYARHHLAGRDRIDAAGSRP